MVGKGAGTDGVARIRKQTVSQRENREGVGEVRTPRVVSIGEPIGTLIEGHEPLHVGPSMGIGEMADLIRHVEAPGGAIVAVHPAREADPVLRRLEAAAALCAVRMARYGTALPPLAAETLAALAAALAADAPSAGALAGALPALERELGAVAWMRSLRGLRDPAPGPVLRMRSLLSRRGYLVRMAPDTAIEPAPRASEQWTGPPVVRPAAIAMAGKGSPADDLARAWSGVLGGAPIIAFDAPPSTARWSGAKRSAELVAYPLELSGLTQRLWSVPSLACPWCRELIISQPCPSCGHALGSGLPPPASPRASEPPPVGATPGRQAAG